MASFIVLAQALNDYKFEVTKEFILANGLLLNGHVLVTDELLRFLKPLLENRPEPKRGGAMVTVASLLGRLGHDVSLYCKLSNDEGARFFEDSCKACGVAVLKSPATRPMGFSCCLTTPEGTRTLLTYLGCSGEELSLSAEMINQLKNTQHLLIEGFLLDLGEETFLQILKICREVRSRGMKIVLTLSAEQTVSRQQDRFKAISELAWMVIGNDEEVGIFAGKHSYQGMLIQTSGAEGAVATINERRVQVPALKAESYVDSIGAGDAFLAGVLNHFTVSNDLKEILTAGSKFGSLACSYEGTDFCKQKLPD